jgi:hypothetical protein
VEPKNTASPAVQTAPLRLMAHNPSPIGVAAAARKGYSEALYRQDTDSFLRCQENGLRSFGGTPLWLNQPLYRVTRVSPWAGGIWLQQLRSIQATSWLNHLETS